jgi:hypothetical protein
MREMKYYWDKMTREQKDKAVKWELELVTHNGTTKDDLLNMVRYLSEKRIPQKAELSVERQNFVENCGFEDKLNLLCPTCKNYVGWLDDEDADGDLNYNVIAKYCSECGQLIEQDYTKEDYVRWGIESEIEDD